ncbi:MAG: HD domain-containing protein [Candidatus Peribacteraceae bacterium]|nr:HD domain-containing protein [Candidatus Peribacteraceae bacterium]
MSPSSDVAGAFQAVLTHITGEGVQFDRERFERAFRIAEEAYGDALHWSGETLLAHAIGTIELLLPFQPDEDALIACLFHHILSVEGWNLLELEQQFGLKVRSLISGVHLLSHVTARGRRTSIEDLRLMLLTVSDDIRTILISLCDRCYLLKRSDQLPLEDRRRIAQDALLLFAPVAARLGIYSIKHALESHAFPVLYPNDAERIQVQIERMNTLHADFLPGVAVALQSALRNEGLSGVMVQAREKQPYSIFMKMRQKSVTDIAHVPDFYACRVVVRTVEECYQALGLLHKLGRPISHKFKDYISFPKPNGYQSLHTTVACLPGSPEDVLIEIQVRTHEMHREAEFGIAAHWSYKSYGSTSRAMEQVQLQRALASQEVLEEDGEYAAGLVDHIFVLSPKGDIIELPEGATPLDFAFQVHTDLGLSFRGARVNGAMVPIDHTLENGDVVEILRHRTPRPSPHWFQLLRVASARSKLKRYLYQLERPALIVQGRLLVNELLRKHHLPPLDQELSALRLCDGSVLSLQEREDLLMKIGQGAERVSSLLSRLDVFKAAVPAVQRGHENVSAFQSQSARQVFLEGNVPMPTRFAKCCKPEEKAPPPPIVGVANRTGIVVIHRRDCGMLRNSNPGRQIAAYWE